VFRETTMSSEKDLYNKLKKAVITNDLTATKRLLKGGVSIDQAKAGFWVNLTSTYNSFLNYSVMFTWAINADSK